jgi:hypothetical protein
MSPLNSPTSILYDCHWFFRTCTFFPLYLRFKKRPTAGIWLKQVHPRLERNANCSSILDLCAGPAETIERAFSWFITPWTPRGEKRKKISSLCAYHLLLMPPAYQRRHAPNDVIYAHSCNPAGLLSAESLYTLHIYRSHKLVYTAIIVLSNLNRYLMIWVHKSKMPTAWRCNR